MEVPETETEDRNRTDLRDGELRRGPGIFDWKNAHKIGTWNVQTLNRFGFVQELETELQKYSVEILALREIRWPGVGVYEGQKGYILYSGKRDGKHEEGVGFYVTKSLYNLMTDFEAINSRLARLGLKSRWFNVTLLVVHAPTEVQMP